MEILLHYAWKHKMFPPTSLVTTEGETVEVLEVGTYNHDAGPDFFNAIIKIGGIMWAGNVEIHEYASDWFRHGHHNDPNYNSVILHVVEVVDEIVLRRNGDAIPQVCLPCPPNLKEDFQRLQQSETYPPCATILPTLPHLVITNWLERLQCERLEQKTADLQERLRQSNDNWEEAFFMTLARNFGFSINADVFERWARLLPLHAANKHRDNLFQLEALFFGVAGFLDGTPVDDYHFQLQQEFLLLAKKFNLRPMDVSVWRYLRLRPHNFPTLRIAQLAWVYHNSQNLLSYIIEEASLPNLRQKLATGCSPYWTEHFHFGEKTAKRYTRLLSQESVDLLIINTVSPFLFAYGKYAMREELCERALVFLEQVAPEKNHITRMWNDCGLTLHCAGETQGLIQLHKAYCARRRCLYCQFGLSYLKCEKK